MAPLTRLFAPEFNRNEDGWILFPRDQKERKTLFFPDEVMKHPAKMNFHLQQSIIEYTANDGDTLLDPFGGTGTLMIAALQGYRVVLIDIEEGYHRLQVQAKENLEQQVPGAGDLVTLLFGDNRLLLPLPCDHIITSPPYAGAMDIRRVRKKREDAPDDWLVQQDERMLEYSKSPRNLSKLNTFLYNMEMEKIYRLCYRSIKPSGTLTIVIKDRIDEGKRLYLSKWVDKVCQAVGFKLELWEKWLTPGHGFTKIAKSQGKEVVEDEDIIIYRR
jgi:DNA modification methylase